jgi:hypothetical protein
MATVTQQEYKLFNQKGEQISIVLVSPKTSTVGADEIAQAQYRAGVAQEYVDATKNSAHQPTHAVKA